MADPHRCVPLLALPMLLVAAAAWSGTIATSPLYQFSPNLNQCLVANPGTSAVKVGRVELMSSIGTVVTQSPDDLIILPGTIYSLGTTGGGLTYCRILNASAKKVRLTHCIRQTGTGSPCISVSTGH